MQQYDVIIVGAGPAGLAAACEAQDLGLTYLVMDRRGLAHSFVEYPQTLRFFSPPDEMAVGDVPFAMRGGDKPTREDALAYYRAVAAARKINLATWETLLGITPQPGGFQVTSQIEPCGVARVKRYARAVVLATGFWDQPRKLECSGANLPHVYSRFTEPTEFFGKKVMVVGGGNSAVTAALSLAEAHAQVGIAMRRTPTVEHNRLRPFVVRDLEFAVAEGKVALHTEVVVSCIEPDGVWLRHAEYDPDNPRPTGQPYRVDAQFVFALLGHTADTALMGQLGLPVGSDGRTTYNRDTYETTVPGIYVAGSLVDIEIDIVIKLREQARQVIRTIAARKSA